MKTIVLTTLNARYAHTAIGLRYLYANMGPLQAQTRLIEFTINDDHHEIAERLLACHPSIIGFGVYIWNALQTQAILELLKLIKPELIIVLGGPEVSHNPLRVDFSAADHIIQGEADLAFAQFCNQQLQGQSPSPRCIQASPVILDQINLPYTDYTDEDILHRTLYIEASRGCPFRCEFCLSSINLSVRKLTTKKLLQALESLWQRGARSFKFVDRTFNLNIRIASTLLDFFLSKEPSYLAHFEVIPDHFPEHLKQCISQFPPATLQLEIGIQTLNKTVAENIHRKLNIPQIEKNIRFLDQHTAAHLHLDLIVGLPGEDLSSFGAGLDRLCAMTQGEIQIGILKKLSGTTLSRHDKTFAMVYSQRPPYEVVQNQLLSFQQIQAMKRFARYWNLYYNSGNFRSSYRLLWPNGDVFSQFYGFSDWLYQQTRSTWKISLDRLASLLFDYLTVPKKLSPTVAGSAIAADLLMIQGRKLPPKLRPFTPATTTKSPTNRLLKTHRRRQLRHSASTPGVNTTTNGTEQDTLL